MPRYYFHLRHPQKVLMDCEGSLLADAGAAREQAMQAARDFFNPALGCVDPDWADWSLDVRDGRGRRVADIALAAAAEPAVESPVPPEQRTAAVVHLDLERARREFAATERRTRELLGRMRMLMGRHRNTARDLSSQMELINATQRTSAALLLRARQQSDRHIMEGVSA
jgi:hypothetical protein